MIVCLKHNNTPVIRLLTVVWLLSWPQCGSAAGTWSVISLTQKLLGPGVLSALAVDGTANLYVAYSDVHSSVIQQRNAQEGWSVIATGGDAPGQVDGPSALAADTKGNLYIAEVPSEGFGRIQLRDPQGHWSVIATAGG